MFTDNLNVSRRTVTRTAAWSVPAVAVVAGAPAYAASSGDQTITRNLKYRVWVKLNGDPVPQPQDAPPYTLPPGTMDQQIWDVVAVTTLPVQVAPNTSLPAPPLETTITTSVEAADTLRIFQVSSVNGSAAPTYTVQGSVVNPGLRTASLTVPTVPTPASGGIVTTASGFAQPETSTTAGTITQFVGKFTSVINCTPSVPISKMGLTGAFEPAAQTNNPSGVNYVPFGEIIVG